MGWHARSHPEDAAGTPIFPSAGTSGCGDELALFHLPANKGKYGLKQENAVDLNSLVRVHASAMVTRAVGYLDETEIEVLGRRLASFLDVDLEAAIREGAIKRWENIVAAQESGRKPS